MTNKLFADSINQIACPVANLCNLLTAQKKKGVGSIWQLKDSKRMVHTGLDTTGSPIFLQ
jgi:hypothetical protein